MTVYLFNEHKALFERIEEQGMQAIPDICSFLSEQKYVTCTNQMTAAIYELRGMLIKVWQDAIILEQARVAGIQNLYEEIVKSNSTVYGID